MTCPNCGGRMHGDGFTQVFHCETVDDLGSAEPDAGPIYCEQIAYDDTIIDEVIESVMKAHLKRKAAKSIDYTSLLNRIHNHPTLIKPCQT